ncbi:bifunctional diguanylate cyclase/phosphodiesterase [Mycobacterium yunnanensis]|uniref:Bifunctional diguanylate cyclase/phosphodiesterase n=1 Tax=Mycobacterium yunnanensis TaxID=368477 RepID=A0A9X3BUQ8_9MYCO|nr:bifunctional diguanylate cyclase/phosphodiesterase [Mycobacterium yunnanensis]MCV7422525.1 bifunctional diguanylate cyclase/phosphodiesterase [Mycobacterium yunnanensis]
MTTRSKRTAICSATVALVIFFVCLQFAELEPRATTFVTQIGELVAASFALACTVLAVRRTSARQRLAWLSMAVGCLGWVLGTLYWAYFGLVEQQMPHYGSIADFGFLALPVGAWLAAVFVPTSRHGRIGLRILLDGVIAGTSLFVVLWVVVLSELLTAGGVTGAAFALSIAYPVADTAVVTMALLLLARARPGRRLVMSLVAAAFVVIGTTDTAFIFVSAGALSFSNVIVVGWATGMYLIGVAALCTPATPPPPVEPLRHTPPARSLWLPYLPVPFAFAVAIADTHLWSSDPVLTPVFGAGAVLACAALVRQFLLLAENRRLLTAVAEMALLDPLTELANRTLFNDRLAHSIDLRGRTGAAVGVLVADLDDFKLVNDSLGHSAGDELLRSVGRRIQSVVRPGDTVARLGGDEFAILVEDAPAVADQIAERIVQSMNEPFVIDGREVDVRVSVGLATATAETNVGAEELFKRADLAMYSAKRAHAGTRSFTPDMRQDATELDLPSHRQRTGRHHGVARIEFVADLRRAVEEGELSLVYQPKVDLATWSAVGVEALIRWPHPRFGLLEPADFLQLVRENGLMEPLTDFVLDRALTDAAGWCEAGMAMPVSVNVSAPSLDDEDLPARVLAALAGRGLSPRMLTVEITEDVLVSSVSRARTVLDHMRDAGVRVAIDDFGSGYAAMTYLHELQVDELKLDRQFVKPILHDERAASIVLSVVHLANEFGLECVAEGVEDRATAERLKTYGCGIAQGHFFSRPVTAQAIKLGRGPVAPADVVATTTATRPSWA